MDENITVGQFSDEYNKMLGTDYEKLPIVCSTGLEKHLIKRKHFDVIDCLDNLEEILAEPDYIGLGEGAAVMFVKTLENNVTTVIKLNGDEENFYVATMYSISDYKLERRILSNALHPIDNSNAK